MIEWIKNLRSTEKGRVLFKFILYMIFFVAVVLLIVITNAVNPPRNQVNRSSESTLPTKPKPEEKEATYFEKQELLNKGHYDFTYRVKGDIIAEYNGEFYDGRVVGYRETEDDLIKYSIEDGIVYLNELTNKTPYEELYLNFNKEFFDFIKLFQELNASSAKIEKNGDEKWYKYENIEGYSCIVTTDVRSIEAIEIYDDKIKYDFTFEYR